MILSIIFILLGIACGFWYLFGKTKLRFDLLLASLWLIAIGVAQLRLSPLERPWTTQFWLLLVLFWLIFFLAYYFAGKFWAKKIKDNNQIVVLGNSFSFILVCLSVLAAIANIYIFFRFGTLPLLSTIPDKMRFIINKEIFGPWEYAALLPRIYIPLSFLFLILNREAIKKWQRNLIVANILLGLFFLVLYASRLTIIITILLCYFSYLAIKIKNLSVKQIIKSALIAGVTVVCVSIAIPAIRQFITYRDYQYAGEYNPFAYISTISQVNLPTSLQFLTPLYLIPTFNLQSLMRATEFYSGAHYYGTYSLSVFNSFFKIFNWPEFSAPVVWGDIFMPWWNTATFIFGYFVDFGWPGILLAAALWGIGLSFIYVWATRRPSLLSAMVMAYLSFVSIMTIYTNYFGREELYMDLALFLLIFLILKYKK
jgi:oligosaccharide repeat unit polymerase